MYAIILGAIALIAGISSVLLFAYPTFRPEEQRRYEAWDRDRFKQSVKHPLVGIDPRRYQGIFWSDKRIATLAAVFAIVSAATAFIAAA